MYDGFWRIVVASSGEKETSVKTSDNKPLFFKSLFASEGFCSQSWRKKRAELSASGKSSRNFSMFSA
jgi:hypothetical protein